MNPEQYLEIIEAANASGKLKRGVNEVTKALERGTAKLVIAATDVSPKEIIMHLPLLSKEKEIPYGEVSSKEELGAAAGLQRSTAAIAVLDAGNAKDILKSIEQEQAKEAKEAKEEKKEEPVKAEPKKEEKVDDKKESKDSEPKKEEVKEESAKEEKAESKTE